MGRLPRKALSLASVLSGVAWSRSKDVGDASGLSSWDAAQTMAKYPMVFERRRVYDSEGNALFEYRRRS